LLKALPQAAWEVIANDPDAVQNLHEAAKRLQASSRAGRALSLRSPPITYDLDGILGTAPIPPLVLLSIQAVQLSLNGPRSAWLSLRETPLIARIQIMTSDPPVCTREECPPALLSFYSKEFPLDAWSTGAPLAMDMIVPRQFTALKLTVMHSPSTCKLGPCTWSRLPVVAEFELPTALHNGQETMQLAGGDMPWSATGSLTWEVASGVDEAGMQEDCTVTATPPWAGGPGSVTSELCLKVNALADVDAVPMNPASTLEMPFQNPVTKADYYEYIVLKSCQALVPYVIRGGVAEDQSGLGSLQWCLEPTTFGEDDLLGLGPVPNGASTYGYSDTRTILSNFGDRIARFQAFKRNQLGNNVLDPWPWTNAEPALAYTGIALGFPTMVHARVRPMLDAVFGSAAVSRSFDTIQARTELFLNGSSVSFDKPLYIWSNFLLTYAGTGKELSDEENSDFYDLCLDGSLLEASAIALTPAFPALGPLLWPPEKRAAMNALLAEWKPLLKEQFPQFYYQSETTWDYLTSGVLDSLAFAGGLSIPQSVQYAMIVLYSNVPIYTTDEDGNLNDEPTPGYLFPLNSDNVLTFYHEVVRLFPPVGGVGSTSSHQGFMSMPDILFAQTDTLDEAGFGPTAADFVIRPLSVYHEKSLGWAGPAMANGSTANPNSRNCPGTDLSITLGTALLQEFVKTGAQACWSPDPEAFPKVEGTDYWFTRDDLGRQGHRTRRLFPPGVELLRHQECM